MKKTLAKNNLKEIECANAIRRYRNEICYTQEYVSGQLGLSQSTYQRIESGDIKVSPSRLSEIAKILKKPIEAFFGRNENKPTIVPNMVSITEQEYNLMQKLICQQEKKIEELERQIKQDENP